MTEGLPHVEKYEAGQHKSLRTFNPIKKKKHLQFSKGDDDDVCAASLLLFSPSFCPVAPILRPQSFDPSNRVGRAQPQFGS